jgi:hypothetical protein
MGKCLYRCFENVCRALEQLLKDPDIALWKLGAREQIEKTRMLWILSIWYLRKTEEPKKKKKKKAEESKIQFYEKGKS